MTAINLSRHTWYVRLFFWAVYVWTMFRGRDPEAAVQVIQAKGTNLCFFVRVIVVWVPLAILLNIALIAAAITVLILLPIYEVGLRTYLTVIVSLAITVGLVALCIYLRNKYGVKVVKKSYREDKPGIAGLLLLRASAWKESICPLIYFGGNK
jgi:hypothetical protein